MEPRIAQLNCAYMGIFKDMLGYARLNRGAVILENVSRASPSRWSHFVAGLRMDEQLGRWLRGAVWGEEPKGKGSNRVKS